MKSPNRRCHPLYGISFIFIMVLSVICPSVAKSQSGQAEDWRLGLMAGTTFYYSSMPMGKQAAVAVALTRENLLDNPHLSLRGQLSYGNLSAHSYSQLGQILEKFDAQAIELSFLAEYDFFSMDKNGFTPYIVAGPGFAYYFNSSGYLINTQAIPQKTTLNVPVGLGFKMRIGTEMMLQLEYLHRISYPEPISGLQNDSWGQAVIGISIPVFRGPRGVMGCWKG